MIRASTWLVVLTTFALEMFAEIGHLGGGQVLESGPIFQSVIMKRWRQWRLTAMFLGHER